MGYISLFALPILNFSFTSLGIGSLVFLVLVETWSILVECFLTAFYLFVFYSILCNLIFPELAISFVITGIYTKSLVIMRSYKKKRTSNFNL